jgi:hypothetical protein
MNEFEGARARSRQSSSIRADGRMEEIRVIFAENSLFESGRNQALLDCDAVCLDVDACLANGRMDEALSWASAANKVPKQVLAVGLRANLIGTNAIMRGEVTLIERTQSMIGLSGPELARAIGAQLSDLYSPFARTAYGFRAKVESEMIQDDDFPEEVESEIDERYCSVLLSPEQRANLLATTNGLDEQSEDEDEEEVKPVLSPESHKIERSAHERIIASPPVGISPEEADWLGDELRAPSTAVSMVQDF